MFWLFLVMASCQRTQNSQRKWVKNKISKMYWQLLLSSNPINRSKMPVSLLLDLNLKSSMDLVTRLKPEQLVRGDALNTRDVRSEYS